MNAQLTDEERSRRKKQAQRAREARRKRRNRILIIVLAVVVIFVIAAIALYENSYAGILAKGNKALEEGRYEEALEYFDKAIDKNKERPEAYTGKSRVYLAKNDLNAAEAVFTDAIEDMPENSDLYEACILFWLDTEQQAKIPQLIDSAPDSVAGALAAYVVAKPEFSLDADKTYDEVQEVSLTCGEGQTIYYTVDGSEPTVLYSQPYEDSIQLGEGTTVIRAIAVDERGIPSLDEERTYMVELPLEDAPAVSPSTGQYETPTKIEIKVPEGYTAYYTLNGVDPSTASTVYEGPVDMPEGDTLFKAIVVSPTGRVSSITTRNYLLDTGSATVSQNTTETESEESAEGSYTEEESTTETGQ